MALSLTQSAVSLIEAAGYAGYSLGLVVDSAGIPIPSEVLIPLAVVSAMQGKFNLWAVLVLGALAQTLGGVIAYEIGRRGGLPLIQRYGKYLLISNRDIDYTRRQFERYGEILAFTGRCLPVIRGYVGFVAGIAEMPFRRFLVATFFGSTVWTLILAAAGYFLASDITVIDQALKPVSVLVVALAIIAVVWFVVHRLRESRKG
jgi:membrane protein DedA with SNARE-associated domain